VARRYGPSSTCAKASTVPPSWCRRPAPGSFTGHLFVFRGSPGQPHQDCVLGRDRLLSVHQAAREHGVPVPPSIAPGETLSLTSTERSPLIDGVDWRAPEQRWRPAVVGGLLRRIDSTLRDGLRVRMYSRWHRSCRSAGRYRDAVNRPLVCSLVLPKSGGLYERPRPAGRHDGARRCCTAPWDTIPALT
jgi:hypothetical protein